MRFETKGEMKKRLSQLRSLCHQQDMALKALLIQNDGSIEIERENLIFATADDLHIFTTYNANGNAILTLQDGEGHPYGKGSDDSVGTIRQEAGVSGRANHVGDPVQGRDSSGASQAVQCGGVDDPSLSGKA